MFYNFNEDLNQAQFCEDRVIELLKSRGATNISKNNDSKYDISYSKDGHNYTLEVKEDFQYHETQNVAVEIKSRGKFSGLCSSKADFWCYVLGDEAYFIETSKLRYHLMCRSNGRPTRGGDDGTSSLILLEIPYFRAIFDKPLTLPIVEISL